MEINNLRKMQVGNPLQKFNKYLQFHMIKLKDLWTRQEVQVSNQIFFDMIQEIGYQLNPDQKKFLTENVSDKNLVSLAKVCSLPIWNNSSRQMLQLINEKSLQLISKHRDYEKQSTTMSTTLLNKSKLDLEVQQTNKNINKQNLFMKINKKIKDYNQLEDKKLQSNIRKNRSEHKFEVLVKMGEINSILERQQSQMHFELEVLSPEVFAIKQVNVNREHKILSYQDFNRIYNQIKKNHKKKQSQALDTKLIKTNFKGTLLLVLEDGDEISKQKLNERIKQRDTQLKMILLETARLKLILKEQYQVLERKGINK